MQQQLVGQLDYMAQQPAEAANTCSWSSDGVDMEGAEEIRPNFDEQRWSEDDKEGDLDWSSDEEQAGVGKMAKGCKRRKGEGKKPR